MPRTRSLQDALSSSPLLDTAAIEAMFPTEAEKAELLELRNVMTEAIEANQNAAQIWDRLSQCKDTAIALMRKSFGIP